MKFCSSCRENKPLEDFHKRKKSKDGAHSYCKICTSLRNKEWFANNKQKHAATCASWYSKNKEKANKSGTDWHYRSNYGISYEDFILLAGKQQNKCAICSTTIVFSGRGANRAVMDHCHTTGNIRGVLCSSCNQGIGLLREDIDILKGSILYLENYNKTTST